jgi:hypothetical protein
VLWRGARLLEEADADSDDWALCEGDCDDADPLVYPNAVELCRNGTDDNCDGRTDGEQSACLDPRCIVVAIVSESETQISMGDPDDCPSSPFDGLVDLVWGDLAGLRMQGGEVDLGTVQQIEGGTKVESNFYDSLRPDPGSGDFVLARTSSQPDYGHSTTGEPRTPSGGDCP